MPVRPYAFTPQQQIPFGNSLQIEITSLDFDEQKEAPSTLQYRIDNLTNSVAVVDWTTIVTPLEVTTLTISAVTNAMYVQQDKQLMQITFRATYADGSQVQVNGLYQINNIYMGTA